MRRLLSALLLAAAACAEPVSRAPGRSERLSGEGHEAPLAVYPSDLGPDSLDVGHYPTAQRRNYAVYSRACAQCHSLSRSLHAPLVGRGFWEFYVLGLRARAPSDEEALSPEDAKAVLDFLEHDERARKSGPTFAAHTQTLARRFEALLDARRRRSARVD